jgi:cytochrome o ubiquinol oxidase subunit 2
MKQGILDPQGPIAAAERLILINATAIMLVVVVPVIVLTLFFAWRYRASNTHARYAPDWGYSGQVELVVWSVPAMVVILLAGVGWISAHQLDPAREIAAAAAPLRVDVVSLDWKWLFIYPDLGVASVDELVLPTNTPVEFTLTSATVMTAFFIPQLGSQIYTMPRMQSHLNLLASHVGDFAGQAAHFSGDGFSRMRFLVHAVTPADFARWSGQVRASAAALDAAAYARLARPGVLDHPQTLHAVDVNLFDRITHGTQGTADAPAAAPRQP